MFDIRTRSLNLINDSCLLCNENMDLIICFAKSIILILCSSAFTTLAVTASDSGVDLFVY